MDIEKIPSSQVFIHFFVSLVVCLRSFLLRSLGLGVREKRLLTWVETRCIEHARRLLSDHVVRAHFTTAELIKRSARDAAGSSHSQQTWHGACGFKRVSSRVVDGGWIRVSLDPWQRSLSPYSSAQRRQRPSLAGNL